MVKIKVKGVTHESSPAPEHVVMAPPEGEGFPFVAADHAGALLWTSYISMREARERCVALIEEREGIGTQADERGPHHPKYGAALNILGQIEGEIVRAQVEYLKHERAADYCWKSMSMDSREREGGTIWFQVERTRPSLLGLWHHPFHYDNIVPRREAGGYLTVVALQFAPPAQADVYIKDRLRRQDAEED